MKIEVKLYDYGNVVDTKEFDEISEDLAVYYLKSLRLDQGVRMFIDGEKVPLYKAEQICKDKLGHNDLIKIMCGIKPMKKD